MNTLEPEDNSNPVPEVDAIHEKNMEAIIEAMTESIQAIHDEKVTMTKQEVPVYSLEWQPGDPAWYKPFSKKEGLVEIRQGPMQLEDKSWYYVCRAVTSIQHNGIEQSKPGALLEVPIVSLYPVRN